MNVREEKLREGQHQGLRTIASRMQKDPCMRVANYETNHGDGTARVRLGKEKAERRKGKKDKTEKGKLAHLAIDVLTWTLNDYGMLMFFFDALCPFLSTGVVYLDFDF